MLESRKNILGLDCFQQSYRVFLLLAFWKTLSVCMIILRRVELEVEAKASKRKFSV